MEHPIEQFTLGVGAHGSRDDGMCAMELVAWCAGEPHSDEPRCACPVLAALVRACNDSMSDAHRNRWLRPLVPMLVGTRASVAVERARGMLVVDTLVRELLPRRLRREGKKDEAKLLAGLAPIERADDLRAAHRAVEHFARRQRAVRWVLERAVDGTPPARYVAGAVQIARALDDTAAWTSMVALIERMVRLTAADGRLGSPAGSAAGGAAGGSSAST